MGPRLAGGRPGSAPCLQTARVLGLWRGQPHNAALCPRLWGLSGEATGDGWPGAAKTVIFGGDGGLGVAARPRDPAGGPAWGLSKGVFLETRPVFVICESGVLLLREGFISFCGQFFSSEVIPH